MEEQNNKKRLHEHCELLLLLLLLVRFIFMTIGLHSDGLCASINRSVCDAGALTLNPGTSYRVSIYMVNAAYLTPYLASARL